MEMLLTLWANDYLTPGEGAKLFSPKRRNGLLRTLALRENFVAGLEAEDLGRKLVLATDFDGSENLNLAQGALETLIDRSTLRGTNRGTILLLPISEAVLWYDARASGKGGKWSVRQVHMRGTGITLARLLLDPPTSDAPLREQARHAVAEIKTALQAASPFQDLARAFDGQQPDDRDEMSSDEREGWNTGATAQIRDLASRVIRHSHAVMSDPNAGPQTKLMNLKAVLALDVAWHIAQQSWEAARVAHDQRYLVFSFLPEPRAANRVRWCSEKSYNDTFQSVSRGVTSTILDVLEEHSASDDRWSAVLPQRGTNEADAGVRHFSEVEQMLVAPDRDLTAVAAKIYEAPGDGYDRPVNAFRVLLESAGYLVGTGKYRYLKPSPATLAGLIASRPDHAPQPAEDFMAFLRDEWNIVIGEGEAVGTRLTSLVDGAELRRNAEQMEQLLAAAGLATALSDQTCMVGRSHT